MLAAEIEPVLPTIGRRSVREQVSIDARIGRNGMERALCKVVDLSLHGARLQIYSGLKRGARMWLTLPVIGPRAATIIWSDDFLAGCQFDEPLDDESFETLLDLDETLRCDW